MSTDIRSSSGQAVITRACGFRLFAGAAFMLWLLLAVVATAGGKTHPDAAISDAQGKLHVPSDYRKDYQYLGTWSVAADKGRGAAQMHVVYASPGAVEAWRKLGHFPNGTVLVKEVFEAGTQPMTTGTVSRTKTLQGWFVMIRDSRNTHPQSPLWGDGWGWAWFDADKPQTTTTRDHAECLGCHEPARATDLIYTEGYPVLGK